MKTSKKLFTFSSLFLLAGVLVGCNSGEDQGKQEHQHSFSELIQKVNASCTAPGMEAYYTCDGCDLVFDADKKETTLEDLAIPMLSHTLTKHDAVAATCEADGTEQYWDCSVCGKKFSNSEGTTEITNIVVPKHSHTMTKHNAVPATCEAAGTVEYWSCSECEKNYSDEAGTQVLESIVEAQKAHTMTKHNAVPATCLANGTVEYWSCSECGKNYGDEAGTQVLDSLVVAKHSHTMTKHNAVPATCEAAGTVEYWSCSECGKNYSDELGATEVTNTATTAIGHNYSVSWAWENDKSKATATFTCSNSGCGDVQTVSDEDIEKVTTAPGYGVNGKDVYTASVTFGGKAYTDTKEVAITATLKVEKGKTANAAIDNIANITEAPVGTAKVQVSNDDGTNWTDVSNKAYDFTLEECTKLKFRALDSSEQVLDTKEIEIDYTHYVGGDTKIDEGTQGISTNVTDGIDGGTFDMPSSKDKFKVLKSTDAGAPSKLIKYSAKTGNGTYHASSRITLTSAKISSKYNSKVPGITQRALINSKAGDYRKDKSGASIPAPYGIKKVAVWALFTNFIVTYEDTTTETISKIYNKGFFMTPLTTASGTGTAPNGYLASAKPYEVIDGGIKAKEWNQFVFDLSDWSDSNKFSLFSWSPTVTLGTLTGNAEDMSKHLLDEGVTFKGKKVVDYTFTQGLNCIQFIY